MKNLPASAPDNTAWLSAPSPALQARDNRCIALNAAARVLFPALRAGDLLLPAVPGWLAGPSEPAAGGRIGDRWFASHRVDQLDGSVLWWLSEVTDSDRARQELLAERDHTALLARLSAELSSADELRCQRITAELAGTHLADVALVVAPGELPGEHDVTRSIRGQRARARSLPIDPETMPGLAEALTGFPPIPSAWIDPALVPPWLAAPGLGPVASVAVTSLPGHGTPVGALVLLRGTARPAFSEDDERFVRSFAARAGLAISTARLVARETAAAATLARQLRPPRVGRINEVDFAGRYQAATDPDRVGGGFYDVYPRSGTTAEPVAVLGDVCGKGLEAAVLSGKVRTALHALLRLVSDHHQILNLLNDVLRHDGDARYVTLALASVSRHGASARVRVTAAGQLPPLVVRVDGRVEPVATSGTLLGVLPAVEATTAEVLLAPGETCLLYSSGITEARGGPFGDAMFGGERLAEALGACAGMPAEAAAEHIHMLASEWARSGRHDDLAVLAITAPQVRRPITG
ncbi:PP2C family protein-serine/threonine phosphatase [Amycolatopsis sp. Hca4]|uniref:PP2C family protein-serine/threonine phosphatase n=1 Tax=Amycolatopsis sp. Hca4 TaxID=2742131 RepID=UPI00159014ED|nr:GAF domain-containing SpoIIE family protein phosphatase [Amycolatopsis sp. Hca4]QKV72466.1 SpoIIE family protein phosphatase [Amycolatopsis sp. Hca4]